MQISNDVVRVFFKQHMYIFKFWFEHGGGCLWSANDAAREQYGSKVNYKALPIAEDLQKELATLETEYHTILDWDDPASGYQWSAQQKADFAKRARYAYERLCAELGADYVLIDELDTCI